MLLETVKKAFIGTFETEPELMVRAPGRINLIGEHTDYNHGFVLPAAIDKEIVFAFSKNGFIDHCTILALDFDEKYHFNLSNIQALPKGSWQNYLIGVVAELQKAGHAIQGFNLVFSGNVPKGSGMSSSAALECGTCFGLNELFNLQITKIELVKISQKAEHNYAGVMCGIMDQFASVMGVKDKAIYLDCETLEFTYFPIELKDYKLVLVNSNVSHSLANSEYNIRRQECSEGVKILQTKFQTVNSLRNASMAQLDIVKDDMSETIYKRCKYVIEENERVIRFTKALSNHAIEDAAKILNDAQNAMRYEYQITCPEIDFLADFANNRPYVAGARMMGGGFGGCTLNIVKAESVDIFIQELHSAYLKAFEVELTPLYVSLVNGVSILG